MPPATHNIPPAVAELAKNRTISERCGESMADLRIRVNGMSADSKNVPRNPRTRATKRLQPSSLLTSSQVSSS